MIKNVFITFKNGETWKIPAHIIADNRSKYYASKDEDTTYKEEYRYIMEDDDNLTDWLFNNMNWVEVSSEAELLPATEFDYDMGFFECKHVVVSD